MKRFYPVVLFIMFVVFANTAFAQCTIDFNNTVAGFTPATPAIVSPGVAYSQSVQVYVPASYSVQGATYTVDSLHIDSISGMPSGISYVFNPPSGTVLAPGNGAVCYSGTTNDSVGLYPLTFYGQIVTNAGIIPFSFLVQLDPGFGYKFRVETFPTAAFVADSPVCAGADTVHFTDLTGGYPTGWAWTFEGGNPGTSTRQFPAILFDSAGTYNVTLIARNGIGRDTITQTVTVNPIITSGGSVVTAPATGATGASNGTAAVNGVTGGTPPYSYLWSNGATGDTLTGVPSGAYFVTVTDSKGCQFISDTATISFVSGMVNLSAALQVKIYPNPATDVLNLVWSQKPNAEVAILDLNGTVISTYTTTGQTNDTYNIHTLAAGAYILRITDKTSNEQKSMLFSKF